LNGDVTAVQDGSMKTLFAKILLAQVATVVVALLVVMVMTRASLHRGFVDFLEQQETAVLNGLAPSLAAIYETRGGWEFLRDQPDNWRGILRHSRNPPGGAGERGRNGPRFGRMQSRSADDFPLAPPDQPLRWLRSLDRLQLRDRLFLLDAQHQKVAGATTQAREAKNLEPVILNGATVGWVGFAPMSDVLPPAAASFLADQARVLSISLLVALALAVLLGFLLARHLSRPLQQLAGTVTRLSHGQYHERATIAGQDDIGRLAQVVNSLAATLEKNRSARHRWMADIAHELRTPVAILKGEIEALTDGVRQPDERTLASLAEEAEHLTGLVNDLQALALADAGALNLSREKTDLAALARQVAEIVGDRLSGRGIELQLTLPDRVELMADPQRLRQLLHNLLANCVRYTETGGWVRMAAERKDGTIHLLVEDSGPGVSDEHLDRLFERFYRVEQARSRSSGGSGLGLAICRNIAEAHGGRIGAAHGAAGGLLIRVELPGRAEG